MPLREFGGISRAQAAVFGLVPAGLIAMWSGLIANIPAGWTLCDGTLGTPDLRAHFVRGAPAGSEAGATGGEDTHVLTVAEMPSHKHSIDTKTTATDTAIITKMGPVAADSSQDTGLTGGGGAHENRPVYYEILFLMRL
jgi:microcystin-dependent protein